MGSRSSRASAGSGRRCVVLVAVIALAAIGAIGALSSSDALAQGFFQDLFGSFPEQNSYRPQMRESRARHERHERRHGRQQHERVERRAWRNAPASAPRVETPERGVVVDQPGGLQSYCVRECDGYFFPVGVYTGSGDTASHQRACGSLCPGARTTLFVLRSGSDKIEDAVAARGRGSCQAETAEPPTSALYRDPTLRRGDAVMTARGVQVFHGGGRYPYTASDFRPLSQTRDVADGMRRKLAALDRASVRGRAPERRASRAPAEHRSQSSRDGRRPRD